MRSPAISRSNCAKESSMLSVRHPIVKQSNARRRRDPHPAEEAADPETGEIIHAS
jgi:hypothetical protein